MMDLGSYGQLQPKKILSVSLIESERLCRKWHGADDGRLEYAFSPRFAVTCSEKLMRSAAEMAQRFGAYLQTHLAENREEIEKVHNLHMWARDYTDVYEKCGLLTPKTMLGHCIHLNPREIDAIAAAQSNVAHCPTSNLFLGSGLLKLDQLLKAGLAVGLGSDVAAGPELNMWQVMRGALDVQKARNIAEPNLPRLRPSEAFYLATSGGARALGKTATIGTLDVGKEADLIVVDLAGAFPLRKNGAGPRRSDHGRHPRALHLSRRTARERWKPTSAANAFIARPIPQILNERTRRLTRLQSPCAKTSARATSRPNSLFRTVCARSAGSSRANEAIVAGVETAAEVFRRVDPKLNVEVLQPDGTALIGGETILEVRGAARSILTAERVALNFLQRLSGIATLTRQFVEAIGKSRAKILDTRKTTPGLRALGKSGGRRGRRRESSVQL